MVPFNSADHSISQGYAWACRGTTIKVGKMQLQTISNMYLSVESLAMIKGPVNSKERKVFLQRHQISLCHDKLPALLAKGLREGRGCSGPWKCSKEQQQEETPDPFGSVQHLSDFLSINPRLGVQSASYSCCIPRTSYCIYYTFNICIIYQYS